MKCNKDDLSLVIGAVGHVHKQLEIATQITLAAVRGLNLGDKGEWDKNHRMILYNHTCSILTWIGSQNV